MGISFEKFEKPVAPRPQQFSGGIVPSVVSSSFSDSVADLFELSFSEHCHFHSSKGRRM